MSLILKPFYVLWFFLMFLWDLLLSSIQVARAVLSPGDITRPRLLTVPLRVESDLQITLVANFITLTPGTLTVDVSPDRKRLLVHDLFAGESSEATRQSVRDGLEARVLKVTQ
jgi:multicomponent Na+:H+ antiporter subunit E